jgi:hypothetical protein
MVTDAVGNTYICGKAGGGNHAPMALQVNRHSLALPYNSLFSDQYAFVVKLDPAGNVLWSAVSGDDINSVTGMTVDGAGNVYLTGRFLGVTRFGTHSITETNAQNAQHSPTVDNFLAKLSAQGQWEWASQIVGYDANVNQLTTDAVGNITLLGNGRAEFPGVSTPASNGLFLARYTSAGQFQWMAGSPTGVIGTDVTLDPTSGDILVAGTCNGSSQLGALTLTSSGSTDAFAAKLAASTQQWQWATALGGSATDEGVTIVRAPDGRVAVGAVIQGTTNIGVATNTDGATALLDGTTGLLLSGGATGSTNARVRAMAIAPDGYVLTGFTSSGTAAFGGQSLPSAGSLDTYLGGELGSDRWALAIGGTGDDILTALNAPSPGVAVVTGTFNSPSLTFGNTTLTRSGTTDAFVARLATPLGQRAEQLASAFALAPNPASFSAHLVLPKAPLTPLPALIIDGMGRVVRSQLIRNAETTLDLSGLAAGRYVVRCGSAVQALVVQ